MHRFAILAVGVVSYAIFVGIFLYAMGFVGNVWTPTRLDGEPRLPAAEALTINLLLLSLFAVQHSVMARGWFKTWWTRIVPRAA